MSGVDKEKAYQFSLPDTPEMKGSPSIASFRSDENDEYLSPESKKLLVASLAEKYNVNEKKLMRKIDVCVVIPFTILFFVAYLNRTNLGYARNSGIESTLSISAFQVVCGFAAFFSPYIGLEIFSNLLLKIIRPHFWISITVLLYGVATLCTGFVHTYAQFIGCEFLHGLFQAGTETAIFYIMAHYYTRGESQKRFSAFYSISCIAGLVGTNICYSITNNLDGSHGLETWRWLFIIEGIVTVISSFILFFIIPDFPEGAAFLSDQETLFVVKKLEIFGGKSAYQISARAGEVARTTIDPLIIIPSLMCFGVFYISYAYAFYEPVLMTLMGLGLSHTNRVSVAPWVVSFVWVNLNGFLSDFFRIRSIFIVLNCVFVMIGSLIIICQVSHTAVATVDYVKYTACFFIVCGSYSAIPLIMGWATMNLGGHLRKSTATAILISVGNAGGLASVFGMNSNKDIRDPSGVLRSGVLPGCVMVGFSIVCVVAYCALIFRENKKKRTFEYKQSFKELSSREQSLKGDLNPDFDYMY